MSNEENFKKGVKIIYHQVMLLFSVFIIAGILLVYYTIDPNFKAFVDESEVLVGNQLVENDDLIENGIHVRTGLKNAEGLMSVVNNCTNCHSAKIVIQNRMSREHWNTTIKWMQETQNLWDLGSNHETIINYLTTNYPVKDVGRRAPLTNIEWYDLEN